MSMDATGWAFYVPGLSHSGKLLLLELADCHCPDQGCFAEISYLTDRLEVEAYVIEGLMLELEWRGFIKRDTPYDPVEGIEWNTRYKMAFEDDFNDPDEPPLPQGEVSS